MKIKKSMLQKDHNKLLNQFAELVRNLKLSGLVADEVCPTFNPNVSLDIEPKLKKLDQSVFDGEDERWKFAVVNKDGSVTLFSSNEIIQHKGSHYIDIFCGQAKILTVLADASNWKNSLIEREEVELIGSGLCREMLKRGDKYIMCSVSDDSDYDAIVKPYILSITRLQGGWFADVEGREWLFAVPIDNQGEPISSKDVGL